MGTSAKLYKTTFIVAIMAALPYCVQSATTHSDSRAAVLKKWTLSRCLSRAARETPFGDDAAKTAAAYLEMGNAPIEVYEELDVRAEEVIRRKRTGSVEGDYTTMKCIDLFESEELDRVVRDAAGL